MQKVLFFIFVVLTLSSCTQRVDFNNLMEDDYINTAMAYPNSTVKLYEVQAVMSKPCNAEENEILASSTIIQIGKDTIREIDRIFHDGKIIEECDTLKQGVWINDFPIAIDSIKYSLNDALEIVRGYKSAPGEPFVTLRRPVMSPFRLQYIFGGQDTYYMFVDAITGEISIVEPTTVQD